MAGYESISPDGRYLYLNTGDVIDTRTDTIIRTLTFPAGNEVLAVDAAPDEKTLWLGLVGATGPSVQAVDAQTGAAKSALIPLSQLPVTLLVSPNGKRVYTANIPAASAVPGPARDATSATISVIDAASNKLVADIPLGLGTFPLNEKLTFDGAALWVTNGNRSVSVIDTATNAIVRTIRTPYDTLGIGLSQDNKRAVVTMVDDDNQNLLLINHVTPAFVIEYNTKSYEPVGKVLSLGNVSGGIPSVSAGEP